MERLIVTSNIGSDGVLRLDLPIGVESANAPVQVTVESLSKKSMTAADLLESPLVGMWEDRADVADNHEFVRSLRERVQTN